MDKAKLAHIPDLPGVYIFKDKRDNILYIGKARSLKKRVSNYFIRPQSIKIQIMVSKVADLDYIVTKSETQARLKEAKLIKENLPPYNTAFRDDKSFPIICISNENFPVVWIARRTSKRLKDSVSHGIGKHKTSHPMPQGGVGVFTPLIVPHDWEMFSERGEGRTPPRRDSKRKSGKVVFSNRRSRFSRYFGPYANAGLLRQALKSIRHIFGFRSCFKMPKRPCLYYRLRLCPAPCIGKISIKKYQEIIRNIILLLKGRQQDLIDKLSVKMHKLADRKKFEEAAAVRNQIQALSSICPRQFVGGGVMPSLSDSYPECSDFLRIASGYRRDTLKRDDIRYRESTELKDALGLNIRPQRIEAFDVSNIFGSSACASMVSFYEGRPDKNNYRRFRIRGVLRIDDYRMLEEAVGRRYRRLKKEKLSPPDLIIIDGGKGQLNIIKRKLKELGLPVPVISIAKQKEEIFISHRQAPIRLKPDSLTLRLIQRIRDEAHRFALAYHHVLRRKKIIGK